MAKPARILLIRHGEKSSDEADIHLNDRGMQRAAALAPYLLGEFGIPAAIYAMAQHKPTSSVRPIETMVPTSDMCKVPLNTEFTKKMTKELAREILDTARYDGKLIFVCWEHEKIEKIAKELGVRPKDIPDWKGKNFDHIWQLDASESGYQLKVLAEHLLYGDKK